MKKLFIIYVIAASIGFSSCTGLFGEGQLDMAPVEDINEDKIFSDYAMFRQYADQAYSYMPGHLGRLWNSLVSSMGDESRNKGGSITEHGTVHEWIPVIKWLMPTTKFRTCGRICTSVSARPIRSSKT